MRRLWRLWRDRRCSTVAAHVSMERPVMTDQRMLGLIMDDLRDQVMAPSATPLGWRLDAARWHLGQVRRALRGQVTDAPPWEDTITAMLNDQTPEAFERNLVILLVERHRKGRW